MGAFLVFATLSTPVSAGSGPTRRVEVHSNEEATSGPARDGMTTRPDSQHRWLHPHGPEPVGWDGDWPEEDLRLEVQTNPRAPVLSPVLPVRLCFCPEVHGTVGHLPGVGASHLAQETP